MAHKCGEEEEDRDEGKENQKEVGGNNEQSKGLGRFGNT
jgi:hypothetical protein